MPLDDAFREDIIAHPDDDAPRLIYADWLEEQDTPQDRARAEFIRVQCALARTDEEGPARWVLQKREAELLRSWRGEWSGSLRVLAWGEEFERGFVGSVTLALEHFGARADEVFRLAPVRRLCLTVGTGIADPLSLLRQVADSPHLSRLTSLRLQLHLSAEAVKALFESPYWGSLDELELHCPELGEAEMRALLASPRAGQLQRLALGLDPEVVGVLAEVLTLTRLRSLHLFGGTLSAEVLQRLAESPNLAGVMGRLEALALPGAVLGTLGAEVLAAVGAAPKLRRLDLSSNSIGPDGMRALAASPLLAGVSWLNLSRNVAGALGVEALAGSPHVGALRTLLLHFNGIPDAGARALASSPMLDGLVWLDLAANRITDAGALALARSPCLANLARLELARNDISAAVAEEVLECFGGWE
jgi:uncharacterized protein (TIGR02996 family)